MARYDLSAFADVSHELTVVPDGYDAWGRQRWRYRLTSDGRVIFAGADLSSPVGVRVDRVAVSALGFLTLRPGDVEAEYFSGYTDQQCQWRDNYAEELSIALCGEDGAEVPDLSDYRVADPEPESPFQVVGRAERSGRL